jgi:hypothetical protein
MEREADPIGADINAEMDDFNTVIMTFHQAKLQRGTEIVFRL